MTTTLPMHCPHCNAQVEAHKGLAAGIAPDAGDLSFCCHCYGLSRFTRALQLRKLTRTQLATLQRSNAWPEIRALTRALARAPENGARK